MSNDGQTQQTRDAGHSGIRLADFAKCPEAVKGKLQQEHVAALRIYSSSAYGRINLPLRNSTKPHPCAATTLFVAEALRKLRARVPSLRVVRDPLCGVRSDRPGCILLGYIGAVCHTRSPHHIPSALRHWSSTLGMLLPQGGSCLSVRIQASTPLKTQAFTSAGAPRSTQRT